jgi:hypothetical protein
LQLTKVGDNAPYSPGMLQGRQLAQVISVMAIEGQLTELYEQMHESSSKVAHRFVARGRVHGACSEPNEPGPSLDGPGLVLIKSSVLFDQTYKQLFATAVENWSLGYRVDSRGGVAGAGA